jgi:NTE family protein
VDLGDRPWLVLGGGGLKGLAHLGAWRVLAEAGFRPAGILGTSIGALAALPGRRSPGRRTGGPARTLDPGPGGAHLPTRPLGERGPGPGPLPGEPAPGHHRRLLPPGGWEAYPVRFQVNAVELGTGRCEWFGTGARTDVTPPGAVYASAALPVFYPPARLPGGVYVDGGVLDALPMARAGARGHRDRGRGRGVRGEVDGGARGRQGMLSIHQRVFSLMVARRRVDVAAWSGPPLLYLRRRLDGYGTFDFQHIPYFLDAGAQAVEEALAGK